MRAEAPSSETAANTSGSRRSIPSGEVAETETQTSAPEAQRCYRHSSRETYISCSQCGRPICTDCMHEAAVGFRCPECVGDHKPTNSAWQNRKVRAPSGAATVTYTLIAINVVLWLIQIGQGGGLGNFGGQIAADTALFGPAVADGEYYRLISSAFLHASVIHIGFNMFLLWLLGADQTRGIGLEPYIGHARFFAIYLASVLWGSALSLIISPDAIAGGASGGVFGLMGAVLVLERQRGIGIMQSWVGGLLLINLVITFALPGISIGGHLGGLAGGAAAAFVLSGFGKGSIAYGRLSALGYASVTALIVGAVAVSIAVA